MPSGNHHRTRDDTIQYITSEVSNYSAYGTSVEDSLSTDAGLQKASAEYVAVLNTAYHHCKRSLQLLVPVSGGSITGGNRRP